MKKKKITAKALVDVVIRAVFFVLFPAVFSTAFAGVKYICQQIAAGEMFQATLFFMTLIGITVFTVIFGRFFCGFACAFGTYGDVLYGLSEWVRKKCKKKPFALPKKLGNIFRYGKYVVLLAVIGLCLIGKSDLVAKSSPWSVFSRLQALSLPQSGYGIGILLFVLISVMMLFEKRFFCRFLCPMGAVFSLLPVWPVMAIRRDRENCIKGCRACQMKCPANIEIADAKDGDNLMMGECFSCGKCVEICPKGNVHTSLVTKEKKAIWLQILKAAVLIALCLYLGI